MLTRAYGALMCANVFNGTVLGLIMIDFAVLTEWVGDGGSALAVGAVLGLAFGFLAQRSGFCARSAFLALGRGQIGQAAAV